MVTLVIGGSGSGKSEYAENLAVSLGQERRIYIATMKPWDEECRQRIERHRQMRAKKQFETVECYRSLKELKLPGDGKAGVILLECMSNLVSNELFGLGEENEAPYLEEGAVSKEILRGIKNLEEKAEHVIIVTNEVFSDGDSYSKETLVYRKVLGEVNQRIGKEAGTVVEVAAGIPIIIKNR
ncbi:MAG: bifunctional adenosylcobinamide kinase/adenosylcobinamide-phosphate guanylyltransferase [Lacrimispora sp.]|uniref:bifunctional adenosylcobinamide kinase/adenosylcobinamide-phosphate guanylyltransferase n=1 Tax=Lacrimispora sp. TaxID=2719234 RepID=UPI0039E377AC